MSKHLYFLGIGGTLMGSLAQLAKQLGFEVSGSDAGIYPPMSDQLAQAGITAFDGFDPSQLDPAPDCLLYTSPSPRDRNVSRMPSSA